jgi:hypothetical protein
VFGITLVASASVGACVGEITNPGGKDGPGSTDGEGSAQVAVSGLRRLTATEYDQSIFDLVGVTIQSETALPEDDRTPFDNDYTKQVASEALISSADSLAGEIATQVSVNPTLRAAITPCEPTGPDDAACFRSFLESFGRRAFRRPLSATEVDRFFGLHEHAIDGNDFWVAVDSALRMFLQHPEFLYRVELGKPVAGKAGVFRLSDSELATRLSYLLWGSTPPTWLLDSVDAGGLANADGVRTAAKKLLEDERAKRRIARFHALWMGYEKLPHAPALATAMQEETQALVNRVVFEEKGSWADLLRSQETFLTPELATHYGLPAPAGNQPGWVSYGDSGRRGLLSQGSFLSAVAKFTDTSPTQRGLLIRTRLFCQTISKPPVDLKVNTDMPPEGSDPNACKLERYAMWKTEGCKLCHAGMDPVGFGLENFDSAGRYRTHEPDRPDCPIDGKGNLEGIGSFTGPSELADLMLQNENLETCVATQLYRFAAGRYSLDSEDTDSVKRLVTRASGSGELSFYDLMLELVTADPFRHRREETP